MKGRRATLLVALAAAIAPMPAPAGDGFGCGGTWRTTSGTPTECRQRLTGFPVTVSGSAIGPGAWIHVRIEIPTYRDVVVIECRATDADPGPVDGVAACEAPAFSQPDLLVPSPEITVRCRVEGRTSAAPALPGEYYCQTGTFGLPGR